MRTDPGRWRRLTPEAIADLPEAAAVFEIANLVRTVLFIGRADGSLRERLTAFVQEHPALAPTPSGFYFRYELVAAEEEAITSRLDAYRAGHGGLLPPAHREPPPALRVAPRRAA